MNTDGSKKVSGCDARIGSKGRGSGLKQEITRDERPPENGEAEMMDDPPSLKLRSTGGLKRIICRI